MSTKVLLVENSKTARMVMTKFLEGKGYEVTGCPNGVAAIEGAESGGFDVIVMDLYMPQMNGYEAAKKIRELSSDAKDVPIIALTASTEPKDENICMENGMNDFVLKSDDNQGLLDALAKYAK